MNSLEKRKIENIANNENKKDKKSFEAIRWTISEILPIMRKIKEKENNYLSQENIFINETQRKNIRREIFIQNQNNNENFNYEKEKNTNIISFNKYKKEFLINEKKVTIGDIVSAKRLGIKIDFDKNISDTGEGKRIIKIIKEKELEYLIAENYGKELAKNLSEEYKNKDLLKSKAYIEIEKRSNQNKEQFGVKAEQIFIGLLEKLSIDRTDLKFKVHEANPYQDVENKIDFIIERQNKKRGIGVEESEKENLKTIGIQFTTALSKRDHKLDQISKAKERIIQSKELDDIIYVEIDSAILSKAINESKKENNKFLNPVKFLPENIKKQILENLFKEILNKEEIKSLERNI